MHGDQCRLVLSVRSNLHRGCDSEWVADDVGRQVGENSVRCDCRVTECPMSQRLLSVFRFERPWRRETHQQFPNHRLWGRRWLLVRMVLLAIPLCCCSVARDSTRAGSLISTPVSLALYVEPVAGRSHTTGRLEVTNLSPHALRLAFRGPAYSLEAGPGNIAAETPQIVPLHPRWCGDNEGQVELPPNGAHRIEIDLPIKWPEIDRAEVVLWYQRCESRENSSEVHRLTASAGVE